MFGRVIDMTRCLVIETCCRDRSRTVGLLQDLGFDVSGSFNMDEAITAIEVSVPEVILVEQRGDTKETSALLMRLRAAARRHGADPLILMCAEAPDPAFISSAMVHGASECLVKPFDGVILENKLKQCGLV